MASIGFFLHALDVMSAHKLMINLEIWPHSLDGAITICTRVDRGDGSFDKGDYNLVDYLRRLNNIVMKLNCNLDNWDYSHDVMNH
jgi:hypothetical protein